MKNDRIPQKGETLPTESEVTAGHPSPDGKPLKIIFSGIRSADHLRSLAGLGPDILGLDFVPDLSPANALRDLPAGLRTAGVFADARLDDILEKTSTFVLDFVCLQGDESPGFCAAVSGFVPVIKRFAPGGRFPPERLRAYEGICEYFLFDLRGPGGSLPGDFPALLDAYRGETPFFLACAGSADMERLPDCRHPHFAGVELDSGSGSDRGEADLALLVKALERSRI